MSKSEFNLTSKISKKFAYEKITNHLNGPYESGSAKLTGASYYVLKDAVPNMLPDGTADFWKKEGNYGTIIGLRRIAPSECAVCGVIHERVNQAILVEGGKAWLKCPRAEVYTKKKAAFIGPAINWAYGGYTDIRPLRGNKEEIPWGWTVS